MTVVTLSCGKSGAFINCKANGHAGFSQRGSDIVCAAISVLLRTAMQVLSHDENVLLTADASERGTLAFSAEVKTESLETEAQLKCIADFIRTGVSSVCKEYPEYVQLRELN